MRTAIIVACVMVAVVGLDAVGAPRITLDEFRIEPTTLPVGGKFTIRARASAKDVKLGSFLLRTAEEVKQEAKIPGLPLYANGKYYAAENGKYFLMDNGPLDRDPAVESFALEVSTQGWREGEYTLAFFASSRPADGPYAVARNDFAVSVRPDRVILEDLDPDSANRSRTIKAFAVLPEKIQPGQPVSISLATAGTIQGLQLTNPYFIAAEDTQPGFQYDTAKKKSFFGQRSGELIEDNGTLDRDAASGKMRLELDTHGWRPGVHHFLLNVVRAGGGVVDHRSLAIQVAGPKDQFEVAVEPSSFFMPGTHFNRFLKLRDGTLLSEQKVSRDGGRTWLTTKAEFGAGGEPLADGRVLGLAYRCLPEEGKEGWYTATRWLSTDGGGSFPQDQARFHVPEAKGAMGHGPHPGPLFMRSIVERHDGSLVALMAGWFKSDEALCPYGRGRPYSRSYVCESSDGGATWQYLTTIGYEQLGSEGYNEGSMRRLPSGEILAVLRTGSEQDVKCQDNPIMWSVSRDEGRTWTRPERTGLEGAFPSLAILSDGVVVMSYGRPGAMIAFSTDGGRTWTDPTPVDVAPYSGYTDVVEVACGELLVGLGAQAWLDPKTGVREDQLRLARVHYRRAR